MGNDLGVLSNGWTVKETDMKSIGIVSRSDEREILSQIDKQ